MKPPLTLATLLLAAGLARAAGAAITDEIRQKLSLQYFRTVETVIADLKKADRRAQGAAESQLWYERYAERIDHLPRESVDEDLLTWGKDVAYKLRAVAASLRGEIVQVQTLEGSKSITILMIPTFYGNGRFVSPVYGGGESNVGLVNLKQGEISAKARVARLQIWDNINEITSTMRNKMTTKFKTPFSPMP